MESKRDRRPRLTLKRVVELSQRHQSPFNEFAFVEVLLRLFITLLEIHFNCDHLTKEAGQLRATAQ